MNFAIHISKDILQVPKCLFAGVQVRSFYAKTEMLVNSLLAAVKFIVIKVANYFFTASDSTQEISLAYLPIFSMPLHLQGFSFLNFFLIK